MLVLGIDTSSVQVTAGLIWPVGGSTHVSADGARLTNLMREGAQCAEVAANKHGELLAPLIGQLLGKCDRHASELSAIGVGLGPGPFTGLRVGIMTAKAMGDALGLPVYGICSLDVIAQHAPNYGDPFAVVTDARRKQVYWRRYDEDGRAVGLPDLARPEDLARYLRDEVRHVVGAGVDLYPEAFVAFTTLQAMNASGPDIGYPSGLQLASAALDLVEASAEPGNLTPLYLRRPDAQEPGKPKAVTPS